MKINIRSNKGVTITGLAIYVISFFMICAVIGVITTFFNNNTRVLSSEATASAEYDVLNAYLAKDVKRGNTVLSPIESGIVASKDVGYITIKFSNNNEYKFIEEDKAIYLYNQETKKYFIVANYVQDAKFVNNGESISIYIKILNKEYTQKYNLVD